MNSPLLSSPIASLFNLAGPDLIIIFLILAVPVAGMVILFMVVRRPADKATSRSSPGAPPPLPTKRTIAERVRELDRYRVENPMSDAEYEEKRTQIFRDS